MPLIPSKYEEEIEFLHSRIEEYKRMESIYKHANRIMAEKLNLIYENYPGIFTSLPPRNLDSIHKWNHLIELDFAQENAILENVLKYKEVKYEVKK